MHDKPDTIEQKLDAARRRLLDLSRRNRLLNYRAKGNRSLRIVDADPATVYRQLVTGERTRLEFLAAEEAGLKPSSDAPGGDEPGDDKPGGDEPGGDEPGSADQPAATSAPRQRPPQQLATSLDAETLDRRLLFLDREAESALQEQGCNILYMALGLVAWKENAQSKVVSLAPLVLVPVDLIRKAVTVRHTVVLWDEEVQINPALREMCRRDFGLALPDEIEPDSDLDAYFESVSRAIEKLDGWSINKEVHLGLFSFAKLLMYLDLDATRWPEQSINRHPFVRGLCGLVGELPECGDCTPAEKLDDIPPAETFQVLDADSSQQVAILAAKKGVSMVIEGPPGTGKSQTITNIIAECLSAGKTVLFVAEKAAALEVVKRRLDGVQLGDFALELHSRKASKREIIEELSRVMNASYPPPERFELDARELEQLRGRLNRYVKLLHLPRAPLEKSLYEAMSDVARFREAPEAPVDMKPLLSVDRDRLARLGELVALASRAALKAGSLEAHPWRGVRAVQSSLDLRQKLPALLSALGSVIAEVQSTSAAVTNILAAPAPTCRGDAQQLLDLVKLVLETATITPEALAGAPWTEKPADVDALLATFARIAELRTLLAEHWKPSAEYQPWQNVLARRRAHLQTRWRWFQPSFYRDNLAIRRHSNYSFVSPGRVANELQSLVDLAAEKSKLLALDPLGRKLFGPLWRGLESDRRVLAEHAAAMQQISRLVREGRTSISALLSACTKEGRAQVKTAASAFVASCNTLLSRYRELREHLDLDYTVFLGRMPEKTTFAAWSARLEECSKAIDRLAEMIDVNLATKNCVDAGLGKFAAWTSEHSQVDPQSWSDIFYRQFLRTWIDDQFARLPEFREFQQLDHDALVEGFCEADKRWLKMSQDRLASEMAGRRPQRAGITAKSSRLGVLEAEMRRKRGLKPIRQLFSQVGDVVQALKPCLMMSPISVAQYLQPGGMQFDVVIFDEASQVEPADALGAVARGQQLILVGDEKQLPPTSFFNTISQAEEALADDDAIDTQDLESVLGQGMVALPFRTTLRWHYRSQHDSLIAFSNTEFYKNDLRVFPSPQFETGRIGLSFKHVPNGVYLRGKGQFNREEAQAVAEAVLAHARKTPHKSLGVGAFGAKQQDAIQDAVEQLRRTAGDAAREGFFDRDEAEPFFVKNLETIQGDERDTIFLSVGYGPDKDGKVTMNFGPLNTEGGWRRLNVLITRARERCVVFSTLTADRMNMKPDTPRGVKALKDYLHFAQHGKPAVVGGNKGDHDSPFERDVCEALESKGWQVAAQVGTAGFSIDLAVVDPKAEGRYLLGIECDGATYHRAATARDRDRLRQTMLEKLGWKLHRIWSTDWFESRGPTLDALLKKLDDLAKAEPAAEPVAPPVTSSSAASAPAAAEPDAAPKETAKADGEPPAMLPGVVPYRRYPERPLGTRQTLLARKHQEMRQLVVDVVGVEGPIHVDEVFRVIAGLFSARVTGATKDRLLDAVELAVRSGRVVRSGEFLRSADNQGTPVRWRGGDDAVVSAALIPPEEVAAAAVLVAEQSYGVPADDLATAALRAMGFKRISPPLAELGRAAVELAIREKRLATDASGYLVPAEPRS
jgi:very-short-patch-repair endonuclease